MDAFIKIYTKKTLERCIKKKVEENYYEIVAISPVVVIRGVAEESLKESDKYNMNYVSAEAALRKMGEGALIFGLRKDGRFDQTFRFKALYHETVAGNLDAEMYGVFALNYEDKAALCAFLTDLSALDKEKTEWSGEELGQFLLTNAMTDELRTHLQDGVYSANLHEMRVKGNSEICRDDFPSWLEVRYLRTSISYNESHSSDPRIQNEFEKWEAERQNNDKEEYKKAEEAKVAPFSWTENQNF